MSSTLVNFNYSYSPDQSQDIDSRFQLNFNPVTRPVQHWVDELLATARLIADSTDKPLYLCLSGGIDSEVMARTFIKQNIPFKALIVDNGHNSHDTRFAWDFCQVNNIETVKKSIDLTNLHKKFYKKYASTNIFRYLQINLIDIVEQLGGTAVLGGGEQIYYTVNNQVHIKYDPGFILPIEYCRINGLKHFPYFHMTTPELLASYMKLDIIELLLKQPRYFLDHHVLSIEKILIYHGYWPGMARRSKYNGWENQLRLRQYIEQELQELYPDHMPKFIPVSRVKSQLGY